jgi:hypothetical protein
MLRRSLQTQVRRWPSVVTGLLIVVAAFLTAAAIGNTFPFERSSDIPLDPTIVLAELPPDFPVPSEGRVEFAGEGEDLPYRIVWSAGESVPQFAERVRALFETGGWELMLPEEESDTSYRVRLARLDPSGQMTHWAMLDVEAEGGGSTIALDFIAFGRPIIVR